MLDYNIDLPDKTILVTSAVEFIGSNFCSKLLSSVNCVKVIGIDNN